MKENANFLDLAKRQSSTVLQNEILVLMQQRYKIHLFLYKRKRNVFSIVVCIGNRAMLHLPLDFQKYVKSDTV